jgi:subtilisin family serine protease
MAVWDKLDSSLAGIYLNYLKVRDEGAQAVTSVHPIVAGSGQLHVTLRYVGDLADIEALGFRTVWKHENGRANGEIALSNVERLTSSPGVIKLSFGRKPRPTLDKSIPQINARPGVWDFTAGAFTGTTGKGVVVGIIDTGIDITHPFFLKTDSPKTTRIRRIWDLGLIPQAGESSPDAALLSGVGLGGTYGVEYTDDMINKVLQKVAGAKPVRHRDCGAHGTHVASIAAGDGRPSHTFIGVAPEADLIVVKYLYLQNDPTVGGSSVDDHQQFSDAVSYILNVAQKMDAPATHPVVINCSFGEDSGPHDGFSENEVWLANQFDGATGKALVVSAGNDGGQVNVSPDGRQHVRIDFPAAGPTTVEIPLDLVDPRTKRTDFDKCSWLDATAELYIEIYYEHDPLGPPGPTLQADLKLPPASGVPNFNNGPAMGSTVGPTKFKNRQFTIIHKVNTGALIAATQGNIEVTIEPYLKRHLLGRYVVKLTCSGQLTAHIWCTQGEGYGFEIITAPALPAIVNISDANQIGSPAGASNVITAACYDAEDAALAVADFSSRGPLVSYNYPVVLVQPAKPDLAAPGVSIDAAKSKDFQPPTPGQTTQMQGTSMSSPHIAGAIALMFQKDPNLSTAQILTTFQNHRLTVPAAPADEVGAGRLDAKDAFDNTP